MSLNCLYSSVHDWIGKTGTAVFTFLEACLEPSGTSTMGFFDENS